MKKLCAILSFLILLSGVANANDSASSGVGGRWRMLKSEHKQVQMVSEQIRMVQQPDYQFQTTANFVFHNHGPAGTVTMGFPEEIYGVDATNRVSMSRFATWVDGRRVVARRHKISNERDSFDALWVKQVRFGRNATRHITVSYLSDNGGGDSSGYQWASYDFTGGNWRGEVRESTLDIRFRPGWYHFEPLQDLLEDKPVVSRKGAHFHFRWMNWQAQSKFELLYRTVFPNEFTLSGATKMAAEDKPSFLAIEPGGVPRHQGIVTVAFCEDSILWKGRLYIHAQRFTPCQWSEKRGGMILRQGKQNCFISARGATHWGRNGPLNSNRPFWVSVMGDHRFFVPARLIAQKLGGDFVVNNRGALYKKRGSTRELSS